MVSLPLCAVNKLRTLHSKRVVGKDITKLRSKPLKMDGKMLPDSVLDDRYGVYITVRYLFRLPGGGHDCSIPPHWVLLRAAAGRCGDGNRRQRGVAVGGERWDAPRAFSGVEPQRCQH